MQDFGIKFCASLNTAPDKNGIPWNPRGMEVAGLFKDQG
jgi:hypothetical protein